MPPRPMRCLLILMLISFAAPTALATRDEKARALYALILETGNSPTVPYDRLEAMPAQLERAGYDAAAIAEMEQITRDAIKEFRRIEGLMIEAISSGFSEKDLSALVAFAKSELGQKLVEASKERTDLQLSPEEARQLKGLARLRWAWTFSRIPRRLKKVQSEADLVNASILQRVEVFKQRHARRMAAP